MSTTPNPQTRSRWLDWTPVSQIFSNSPECEPTKPSKPGFVGFVGAHPAQSPEIEAMVDPAELRRARAVCNRLGVRVMCLDGVNSIGVWSDLDGPEVRAAIRAVAGDGIVVRYLDGAAIPGRYKTRRVEADPVPATVLAAMELADRSPWSVRDRLLKEIAWCAKGHSWPAWTAASMKRLFETQGAGAAAVKT